MVNTYIVSAYYHSSECIYAFGPFFNDAAVNKFVREDSNPDKHEQWTVTLINAPSKYNTGKEINAYIWEWY